MAQSAATTALMLIVWGCLLAGPLAAGERVPENAYVVGNAWYCKEGFKRVGERCEALQVPANAYVVGNAWYCKEGYRRDAEKCVLMTPEEIAEARAAALAAYLSASDGTVAYRTKIDSDKNEVLILENDAILEITAGYLGYIGYRKDTVLFRQRERCRIWIEGKRVFDCRLLREPSGRALPAKQVHISEVKGDGAILLMLDGSIYEVDSLDRLSSALWLGPADGLLIDGEQLLNFDQGELVRVSRIR